MNMASMFPLEWECLLAPMDLEFIVRDFMLILEDSSLLIIATMRPSSVYPPPRLASSELQEAFTHLDDYTFHLIETQTGRELDRVEMFGDKVMLANQFGVGLLGRGFGVMSIAKQVIHLYKIVVWAGEGEGEGEQQPQQPPQPQRRGAIHKAKFVKQCEIGEHALYPDDDDDDCRRPQQGRRTFMDGYRQKLMTFLYKESFQQGNGAVDGGGDHNDAGCHFNVHRDRQLLSGLCFWKFQYVTSDLLLIRLGDFAHWTKPQRIPATGLLYDQAVEADSPSLHMLWDAGRVRVVQVFCANSWGFARFAVDNWVQLVAGSRSSGGARQTAGLIEELQRFKGQLGEVRDNELDAFPLRQSHNAQLGQLLSIFPMSPQTVSVAPLLDPSVYRRDSRVLASVDRPQAALNPRYGVRFYSTRERRLMFTLPPVEAAIRVPRDVGEHTEVVSPRLRDGHFKRKSSWIWHPEGICMIRVEHQITSPSTLNVYTV